MRWIGIDPGKTGAIVVLSTDDYPVVAKMPDGDDEIARFFSQFPPGMAFTRIVMERMQAMPQDKRGTIASFKLGVSYGTLRGILAASEFSYDVVTPQKWQKTLGCLSHGDKHITRTKAGELMPTLRLTLATADAALLAYYCWLIHGKNQGDDFMRGTEPSLWNDV